jgi:hypothetical protein
MQGWTGLEKARRAYVRSPLRLAPTFWVRGQRAYVARNRTHGEDDAEKKEKPFASRGFGVVVLSRIPLRCICATLVAVSA